VSQVWTAIAILITIFNYIEVVQKVKSPVTLPELSTGSSSRCQELRRSW
jgi:hypothetical protein